MATEIERKFLACSDHWKTLADSTSLFKQAYLNSTPERTVRVRITDKQAYITIKSINAGIRRQEFEYAIPVEDAEQLLLLCETPPLEKIRHTIRHGHHLWEVDEFLGINQGLVLAEIELLSEDEQFSMPSWLGMEVSADPRYFNSYLSNHPYTSW